MHKSSGPLPYVKGQVRIFEGFEGLVWFFYLKNMKNMKDLKCCFGFLFEKYEKISKLEVLIGAQIAQIVGTPDVVDLWVKRTMYPST